MCVVVAEVCEFLPLFRFSNVKKIPRSFPQHRKLPCDHPPEVDTVIRKGRYISKILVMQHSPLHKLVEAEQKRISGYRGEALKGRITITSGVQGEHLPEFLARGMQEIDKPVCFAPQISDTIRPRQ